MSSTLYAYDRLYRLPAESGPAGSISYGYDPVGNRLSRTEAGITTNYTYDRADRILSVGGQAYANDANGNVVSRGTDVLTYDQANRLVAYQKGATTAVYAYDGDGKRASRTVGTYTRPYLYDIKAATPKVLDDGERRYIWRPGLAYTIGDASNAVESVYHTDGIDSARVLTNAAGAVTDVKRTDAFGVLVGAQGSSPQPFGFAGEMRDNENELMQMGARAYDPKLGRFIQRDTMVGSRAAPTSLHRFAYSLNNPVRYVDPSGFDSEDTVDTDYTSEITGTCCDASGNGSVVDSLTAELSIESSGPSVMFGSDLMLKAEDVPGTPGPCTGPCLAPAPIVPALLPLPEPIPTTSPPTPTPIPDVKAPAPPLTDRQRAGIIEMAEGTSNVLLGTATGMTGLSIAETASGGDPRVGAAVFVAVELGAGLQIATGAYHQAQGWVKYNVP